MEPPPRSPPCRLIMQFTEAEVYYTKVKKSWPVGSIGCKACYMWMRPNNPDSHVKGKKHQKRIAALGVQTEDVLETRTAMPGDDAEKVIEA